MKLSKTMERRVLDAAGGTVTINDDPICNIYSSITESEGKIVVTLHGPAMGKPRMTQRDKWAKRAPVLKYRAWGDALRFAMHGKTPVAESVIECNWTAYFEPPKSWSKKKRDAAIATQHRSKPDRDNIDKAVLDVLWPKADSAIACGKILKLWGETSRIVIEILFT